MDENKITFFKRIMASVCHYCPLCIYGRKNPESIVGRVLHHRFHADYCPPWKAEIAVYNQGNLAP